MSFTENTYHLSDGISIFFTDSGPPPGSTDYTTLVILHGTTFNGHGFELLHEPASHKFNLRTIIWNRREYPGSTPYTDNELQELREGNQIFIDRLGIQIADFLKQFIKKENIPRMSEDGNGRNGGVAIMGWSMGTATAMPIFSDTVTTALPEGVYDLLEGYIRELVLYDPPHFSFGYTLPPGTESVVYDPWTDPECKTLDELYDNFSEWVGCYWDHPDNEEGLVVHKLDFRKRTPERTKWTAQQFERMFTKEAGGRSEFPMYFPPMQPTLNKLAKRVLFPVSPTTSGATVSTFPFPKAHVIYLVATRSAWPCIYGYTETKRFYAAAERGESEGSRRRTTFIKLEGLNHFAHMDEPERFLGYVVEGLKA